MRIGSGLIRLVACLAFVPSAAWAQANVDTVSRGFWNVEGVVQLGRRIGPKPVSGQWVVIHRIVSDASGKVGGGPLDSARTNARGEFRIRYPHFGSAEATYIAITTYAGVSYLTAPLTRPSVTGEDAVIMVFDTTAPPYPIRVAGRHFVVTGPDTANRRRVVEVYELSNDSVHTVMGTASNPVWRAALPDNVNDLQLNPAGDITPGTTKVEAGRLNVFTPISPGLRQLSFTYTLPAKSFPLSLPIVDSITVLEILVEELGAIVDGAGLIEVESVDQEGRRFRRFLARDVHAGSVIRFTMPGPVSRFQKKGVTVIASTLGVAMMIALCFAFVRSRSKAPLKGRQTRVATTTRASEDPVVFLAGEIARMEHEHKRNPTSSEGELAEFTAKRAELKARLTAALAARNQAS